MLTPLEIQNKVFKKEMRGYSPVQVDEFLNLVIESYEAMYKKNRELMDENAMLNDAINRYKSIENTLQNTLIAAQTAGDQIQRNANERAENIIQAAHNKSLEIVSGAHQEVYTLSNQYETMKNSIDMYRSKMLTLVESQLSLLKSVTIAEGSLLEVIDRKQKSAEINKAQTELPDLDEPEPELSEEMMETLMAEE